MRVLWIVNIVINDFTDEYGIHRLPIGGWLESMLHRLEQEQDLTVGLCFPIIDEERMKTGVKNNHPYYSFHSSMDRGDYNSEYKEEFKTILRDFKPDMVHIWGTEYNHARAMAEACHDLRIRTLISIQGLVSMCSYSYDIGVPPEYLTLKCADNSSIPSIFEAKEDFFERGKNEKATFQSVDHITDCTEWGRICAKLMNPRAKFHFCNELLRAAFYDSPKWSVNSCKRHTLFVSQASYPIKGLHFLLKAMAIIRETYPDVKLHIAGTDIMNKRQGMDGYAKYITDLISELKLFDSVQFVGRLSDTEMIKEYLNAHIFVSPSTIEDSSNSICEAMLLGAPVVASYVGGTPELMRHGESGLLYPVNEHYMLAGYIMQIFEDDNIATSLSKNAIKTAEARHDRDKTGRRMMSIYRETCEEENGR